MPQDTLRPLIAAWTARLFSAGVRSHARALAAAEVLARPPV